MHSKRLYTYIEQHNKSELSLHW